MNYRLVIHHFHGREDAGAVSKAEGQIKYGGHTHLGRDRLGRQHWITNEEAPGVAERGSGAGEAPQVEKPAQPEQAAKPLRRQIGLIGIGQDAKTVKGQKKGFLTGILYLAPDRESGRKVTMCPGASSGCKRLCLFDSGKGGLDTVRQARINKTLRFLDDKEGFLRQLIGDIEKARKLARKRGMPLVIRLNGTSDVPWEKLTHFGGKSVMEHFPDVQFYDYTKIPHRMKKWLNGEMPPNYHLTYSLSETPENRKFGKWLLDNGQHVAVPFNLKRTARLPESWSGYKVLDGDETDLRFLDERPAPGEKGKIIGLRYKRPAGAGARKTPQEVEVGGVPFVVDPENEAHNLKASSGLACLYRVMSGGLICGIENWNEAHPR